MKKPNVRPGAIAAIVSVSALLGVVILGSLYGLPLVVLGLATAALGLVIALLWASVSSLAGDTPLSLDEAISYGAPSFEEEQKTAVLRALNDLQFERSVGKISEEDFAELSAKYREEAKRLIARVDESLAETRKLAEQLAEEQLNRVGLGERVAQPEASPSPAPAQAPKEAAVSDEPTPSVVSCVACETANDLDARFCKRCGKALGASALEKDSSTEKFA